MKHMVVMNETIKRGPVVKKTGMNGAGKEKLGTIIWLVGAVIAVCIAVL